MSILSTVDDVIAGVGGPGKAAALAGLRSDSAPLNWRTRGVIPPEYFVIFSEALKAKGHEVDRAVFGFKREEARA